MPMPNIDANTAIRGFPLPGIGQVKVSAYADDVSLFIRDEDSYQVFMRLFNEYGELSGARLNRGKSMSVRFGTFSSGLAGDLEWVTGVRVLGVVFRSSSEVARSTWKRLLETAEQRLAGASKFRLSLAERSYIIKSSVSTALFYVALSPRHFTRHLATKFGSFFWADKTETVSRALLRLANSMGGFSLPCLNTMCSVLSVRSVFDLVDSTDYPWRARLQYFLGTSCSMFYAERIAGPFAEQSPPFYTYVVKTLRNVQSALPSLNFRENTASELCEKLAITQLDNHQIAR